MRRITDACRARERIEQLLDPEGRYEIGSEVAADRQPEVQGHAASIRSGCRRRWKRPARPMRWWSCREHQVGVPLVLAVFEFDFMGGSMGSVVGERFVRGVRVAYENRVPFVCITSSGGARMQEGVSSLFQMAKTTAVLQELTKARAAVRVDPHRSDDGRRVGAASR